MSAIAAVWLWCSGSSTHAQDSSGITKIDRQLSFDIPAQNLDVAIGLFASVSGYQVLYDPSLTAGRRSASIKGSMTPEESLSGLLAGTGLVMRMTDSDAITIARDRPNDLGASLGASDIRSLGELQAAILSLLCKDQDTRPGSYRAALQVWIAPSGELERVALLDSTGSERRDRILLARLFHASLVLRSPIVLRQPLTMAIVPQTSADGGGCEPRY